MYIIKFIIHFIKAIRLILDNLYKLDSTIMKKAFTKYFK